MTEESADRFLVFSVVEDDGENVTIDIRDRVKVKSEVL